VSTLDPISIATLGYACGGGPDDIAIATIGYICLVDVVIVPVVAPGGSSSVPGPMWWKRMNERTKKWEREAEEKLVEDPNADINQMIIMEEEEILAIILIAAKQVLDDADT
jgi:hypothetical protein